MSEEAGQTVPSLAIPMVNQKDVFRKVGLNLISNKAPYNFLYDFEIC